MKNNIKFYMVPASPWSFLSFERLKQISNSYDIDIDLIPVDISKLFELQDIKMLSKRPQSIQKNRLNELKRWRNHLKIKFNLKPKFFPVSPIKSCKLLIACSIIYPREKNKIFMLAKSLSEAVWVNELNIDNDEVIFEIAKNIFDIKSIQDIYLDDKVSSILKNNTMDAVKQDIFGVPTFIFNNQMFWGQDRIFFLEKEIKKLNA